VQRLKVKMLWRQRFQETCCSVKVAVFIRKPLMRQRLKQNSLFNAYISKVGGNLDEFAKIPRSQGRSLF
jgi:hypothetical protein